MERPRPRARAWWWVTAAGVALAVAPLAVAFFGLLVESQYLQTYHWLLYYSIPIGGGVALVAAIVAGVLTVRDRSRRIRDQGPDRSI